MEYIAMKTNPREEMCITVGVANTEEELKEIARLRFEVYCYEMGSLDPADYPDKKEYDFYDQYSVYVFAKHNGSIIGVMRLIKDSPRGFLMEQRFILPKSLDRAKTVEHSRAIVRKEYRGRGIFKKLLEKAYEWQLEYGFTIVVGAAVEDTILPILLKCGYKTLAPCGIIYHNVSVMPVIYYLPDTYSVEDTKEEKKK